MLAEHAQGKGRSLRLGGARADFVASLGKKVTELRALLGRVRVTPEGTQPREELRRKLHALGQGARMMRLDAMERSVCEATGLLDRASDQRRIETMDLDTIEQVLEDLPALAWGEGVARSSREEEAQREVLPHFHALVVGPARIADALLDEPSTRRPTFECDTTPDAQAAFELARSSCPDVIVLDADVEDASELVEALMDEPLTESLPIIVVGSFLTAGEASLYVAMGVAKTIAKPTSRETLRAACEEALRVRDSKTDRLVLGEPTLEQLGERLADEIRQAIVGRSDPAMRELRVPLGEGTEIMAPLWGAIARVREIVMSRTNGAVRFGGPGPEGAIAYAGADVARADRSRGRPRGTSSEVRLSGRRVLVVDDDPGVVWFITDLLKTAGCAVQEAFDGKQALDLAFRTSPDLVISDILMPELDGFALCRSLKRDVALRDTPVILLSWKEDLLQRVRELGADAAGYLRKESDARAMLARVREALRPRASIEARLGEGEGEVRGRLDGISVRSLLEMVCAMRPEARVSIRDASFLYEVEVRYGAPVRATRTAGDGSFTRGTRVLGALLGVGAGRFVVAPSEGHIEPELDGNLSAQLARPIARARAALDLLTGAGMGRVERVRLDAEALDEYLRATPRRARELAHRIADGEPPSALLVNGACEPSFLEDLLADLSARGVVSGIDGAGGIDVFGPAVEIAMMSTDQRASLAPRTATPSPDAAQSVAAEVPEPPASLEDAVVQELSHRSPTPEDAKPSRPRDLVEAASLKPRTSPPPAQVDVYEGTPHMEEIVALAEPTVLDDAPVAEWDAARDDDEDDDDSAVLELAQRTSADDDEMDDDDRVLEPTGTPPATITTTSAVKADEIPKKKAWPMIALLTATVVIGWAALQWSQSSGRPQTAPRAEPPAVETKLDGDDGRVDYVTLTQEAEVPSGQGVLQIDAPEGVNVHVDGTDRGRGAVTVPLWAGSHDVRLDSGVATSGQPRQGRLVEVRAGRVARLRFGGAPGAP